MAEEKYKSLYDFLKRAAGPDLGKAVQKAARLQKVKIKQREVSNPSYNGKINTYPESFLVEYFNKQAANSTGILYNEPDNLPL